MPYQLLTLTRGTPGTVTSTFGAATTGFDLRVEEEERVGPAWTKDQHVHHNGKDVLHVEGERRTVRPGRGNPNH